MVKNVPYILLSVLLLLIACSWSEPLPGESCLGECSGMTFTQVQMQERFGIINYSACVDCDPGIDGYLYAEATVQGEDMWFWYNWTSCESPICGWHACVKGGSHTFEDVRDHLCDSIQERSTSTEGCPYYELTNETRDACRRGEFQVDDVLAIHQEYTRCGSNVTISPCDGFS